MIYSLCSYSCGLLTATLVVSNGFIQTSRSIPNIAVARNSSNNPHKSHLTTPLPLGNPLPIPLAPRLAPAAAPPLALGTPLPIPLAPTPLPLPTPPLAGPIVCLSLTALGVANLLAPLPLVGGFSTKLVSFVKKVASASTPPLLFTGLAWLSRARAKDCAIGASGKSTQKALIFRP